MPQSRWFLRIAASTGVLSVVTMEAGWTVTEVGRQPWIVHNNTKVEDTATGNTGVWITFIVVVVLYLALGMTTILVLRAMSRRSGSRMRDFGHPAVPGGAVVRACWRSSPWPRSSWRGVSPSGTPYCRRR